MNIVIVEKYKCGHGIRKNMIMLLKNIAPSSSYLTASQTRQNDVKLFK